MRKVWIWPFLTAVMMLPTVLRGSSLSYDQARPLMALASALQQRYGILVTYEDVPADPVTETAAEMRPNGKMVLSPKWKAITFRVDPTLEKRPDESFALADIANSPQVLQVLQGAIKQYNESGNPGRFSVVADGEYFHIQQTARIVNGRLEAVTPVSALKLKWQGKSGSCRDILNELKIKMDQQLQISVAEGAVPMGALLTRRCQAPENLSTVGQVLETIARGLSTNNEGVREVGYASYLAYDPNWNKYFVSLSLVGTRTVQNVNARLVPEPNTVAPHSATGTSRLGTGQSSHASK